MNVKYSRMLEKRLANKSMKENTEEYKLYETVEIGFIKLNEEDKLKFINNFINSKNVNPVTERVMEKLINKYYKNK